MIRVPQWLKLLFLLLCAFGVAGTFWTWRFETDPLATGVWSLVCAVVSLGLFIWQRHVQERDLRIWSTLGHDLLGILPANVAVHRRNLLWVNPEWQIRLGWSPQELSQLSLVDLFQSQAEAYRLLDPRPLTGPTQAGIKCRPKQGLSCTYLLYEWSTYHHGDRIYLFGRPVTAPLTDSEELSRTLQDLQARNADLERFASVAAHQLRAPTRSIAGMAQALMEDYSAVLPKEGMEFLEDILSDANLMASTVDGLYRFSKVRTHESLEVVPIDCETILTEIREARVRQGFLGEEQLLTWDPLPQVLGSRLLIQELLTNLIDNGFKFNESPVKKVHISFEEEDDKIKIHVVDNGIGIPLRYQPKLFSIFQRVHPQYAGTGVGLALAAAIVSKLGGEIRVVSDTGSGSDFWFTLPKAWTE